MAPRSPRLSLLLAVGLAACGPSAAGTPAQANTCEKSSDCATGFYCNAKGFCQLSLGCTADSQCQVPLHCDLLTGECLCSKDGDCPSGQLCNSTGHCQSPADCFYDTDCATGYLCDTASHACIQNGSCLADVQCPLGHYCSKVADGGPGSCVAGCIQDGDCPLADITGPGQVHYVPQACLGGVCTPNGCNFTSNCLFGEVCVNNQCQSACSASTPYCQTCDPKRNDQCGNAGSCLDDPRNQVTCTGPGNGCLFFCGVDCSTTPCPSGYTCGPIVVIVPSQGAPDGECACGESCNDGTPCLCQEGATSGFCPCHNSSDCPTNSCLVTNVGTNCILTGASCTSDADCTPPTCDAHGNCVSAHACGPDKQYNCPPGGGPCEGG